MRCLVEGSSWTSDDTAQPSVLEKGSFLVHSLELLREMPAASVCAMGAQWEGMPE